MNEKNFIDLLEGLPEELAREVLLNILSMGDIGFSEEQREATLFVNTYFRKIFSEFDAMKLCELCGLSVGVFPAFTSNVWAECYFTNKEPLAYIEKRSKYLTIEPNVLEDFIESDDFYNTLMKKYNITINDVVPPDEWSEFRNRLNVAINSIVSGALPIVGTEKDEQTRVKIADFVAFADKKGWELPEKFPRPNSAPLEKPTTSRDHVSKKLERLNIAADRFWRNADRDDRETHPTNAAVAAWLMKHGFSAVLADKAATIIRPEWAKTGRRPEE